MIAFEEARSLVSQNIEVLANEELSLASSLGRVLAEDVLSASDHPRFDNTAVDGYAFAFERGQRSYRIVGEIAAGDRFDRPLQRGECVRIFTGACLPSRADTCVMQEYTECASGTMSHSDASLKRGSNVRKKGEELAIGATLIRKGERISAQAIGLLASCGVECVQVSAIPRVHVIITGNEFTAPQLNEQGKIFNSNGPMLQAALRSIGVECTLFQEDDDVDSLKTAFESSLNKADLVISTGGVSVGKYDHVLSVCASLNVRTVFHKVAQKPGKPLYFGRRHASCFIGLPGNPRAVMIGFWFYVLPLLNALQGANALDLPSERSPLGEALELKGTRTELLAVQLRKGEVFVSKKQNSHMLSTLLDADGIAIIPASKRSLNPGESVQVLSLPKG